MKFLCYVTCQHCSLRQQPEVVIERRVLQINTRLYYGLLTFFHHRCFSFLTFERSEASIFFCPQALGFAPTLFPYIKNSGASWAAASIFNDSFSCRLHRSILRQKLVRHYKPYHKRGLSFWRRDVHLDAVCFTPDITQIFLQVSDSRDDDSTSSLLIVSSLAQSV